MKRSARSRALANRLLGGAGIVLVLSGISCADSEDPSKRVGTSPGGDRPRPPADPGLARDGSYAGSERTERTPRIKTDKRGLGLRETTTPSGAVVLLPNRPKRRYAPPASGCATRRAAAGDGTVHAVSLPRPPGVEARRLRDDKLLVSYRVGTGKPSCRAVALEVTIDLNDDLLPGHTTVVKVRGRRGHVRLSIPRQVRPADVVRVRTRTQDGRASESSAVLID
jgi:hypothetical protein